MASTADDAMRKMEALSRPSTRYRDLVRELPDYPEYDEVVEYDESGYGSDDYCGFAEVELLPHLSSEDIATTGITWETFDDYFDGDHDRVVWITPDVYIYSEGSSNKLFPWILVLSLGEGVRVHVREGTAAAVATAACDFLVTILATREEEYTYLEGRSISSTVPISGPGLSRLFQEQESRDGIRTFTLDNMALNEDQCRALATVPLPTVEITLASNCSLSHGTACQNAFSEGLQSGRGPIELHRCRIDSRVLAAGLTGNSRVTRLLLPQDWTAGHASQREFLRALANNSGLEYLDVGGNSINDENWTILCESLQAHPTLTRLDLMGTMFRRTDRIIALSDEQKSHRTRVLAGMVQRNTMLLAIGLSTDERDQQIYTESIIPCLQANRYRPRVLAIKKADISLRRPLLGRALQTRSVWNKASLLWMFLSGNADVVLQSNEEDEQVEVAASVQVDVAARALVDVAASAPVDVAASAPVDVAATRKRKI
jgi:hypothetical protein